MKSYLSLIPISAKVHRRQNRMTLLCIVFAVFMVTAVFSMAEMGFRMEQARLVGKHGSFSIGDLLGSSMGQTLLSVAVVLFLLILIAGVLMISSSMNSSVAQRTKFFGMMRCIGMSKQQIIRFVRLEALNWCKTAVPIGLILGVVTTWGLCAVLRFVVREEFSDIPLFGISIFGIVLIQTTGDVTDENVQAIQNSVDQTYSFRDKRDERTTGTYMAFVFCVYAFLAIIALVTVMNIVNSISMSVSARMKQYGAMRAVGMDERQMTKMIACEAFTYAVLGCVVGCAIGLPLSKSLYDFLIAGHFPSAVWQFPIISLGVILLFVSIAAIAAVYAPAKRIRNMSITATINEL